MKKCYKRLTLDEQIIIEKQLALGDNRSQIALLLTKNTKVAVYFAHPYSPWEGPTNENSNGLLRDYFPKGMDLSTITKKRLKEVQNQLNERPRKVLNWQKPKEVFDEFIMKKIEHQAVWLNRGTHNQFNDQFKTIVFTL